MTTARCNFGGSEAARRKQAVGLPHSGSSPPLPPMLSWKDATYRITTAGYTFDLKGNLTVMPRPHPGQAPRPAPAGALPRVPSSMVWDKFDRMVSVTESGATITQKYDAFGRRIARIYGTGVFDRETYFYDVAGRVISIHRRGQSPYQPERLAYFAGNRVGDYTDRLGSVRRTSSTVNSHYYPYGEEIASTSNDRYKFAELYRDSDTGLDYAMARYYAPSVGRFLGIDGGGAIPKEPQSWNRFTYALNDPVTLGDPGGRMVAAPTYCYYESGWSAAPTEEGTFGWLPALYFIGCVGGGSRPAPPDIGGGRPDPPAAPPYFDCRAQAFGTAATIGGKPVPTMEAAKVLMDVAGIFDAADPKLTALVAMTWAFETQFSFAPINNLNNNLTIDYGPMQLNSALLLSPHESPVLLENTLTLDQVRGTNLEAGQRFNGDSAANVLAGARWVAEKLHSKRGDPAAAWRTYNPRDAKRASLFTAAYDKYTTFIQCMLDAK